MVSRARKTRSRETEKAVAEALRGLYPDANAVPSALPGKDILNTPGLAVEVKARRNLDLPAWCRQSAKNAADGELPVVVSRPDGFGPASIGQWPVIITMESFLWLLECAGYGTSSTPRRSVDAAEASN